MEIVRPAHVKITALLVWPWVTITLLNAVAIERGKWNLRPMVYGYLFYTMLLVAVAILVCEANLRYRPDFTDPAREAETTKRCLIGVQSVSALFALFTLWTNYSLFTQKGDAQIVVAFGFNFACLWIILVAAPPLLWFALNVWRWRDPLNNQP